MSSTNKTSLGLNMWEASDKPVRQDFVNDNAIIDEKVSKLEQNFSNENVIINEKITKLNSNLASVNGKVWLENITNFTCGLDPKTKVLYLRGYINSTDFYQLNCEPGGLLFGKQINGEWTGIWSK